MGRFRLSTEGELHRQPGPRRAGFLCAGGGRIRTRQTNGLHEMRGLARAAALTHTATPGLPSSDSIALAPCSRLPLGETGTFWFDGLRMNVRRPCRTVLLLDPVKTSAPTCWASEASTKSGQVQLCIWQLISPPLELREEA